MKLSKFGRISLALAASLVIAFGTDSCHYNYTEAYIIVTGSQYNQVASFKENNETGVLLPAPNDPQSSVGNNPIRAALLIGGRYVYVLNEGSPTLQSDNTIAWKGGGIALFSIGGDGQLAYQTFYSSQGLGSIRLAISLAGTYLYVLDQYQPGTTPGVTPASTTQTAATPCYDSTTGVWRPAGDVTVFSIDGNTGRLFLLQNQQQQNSQGTPLSYFPIGCGPIDFHLTTNYLYTGEQEDPASGNTQVVYTYSVLPVTGQLVQVPGGAQPIGTSSMAVIGSDAANHYIYVLDNGSNMIYTFTAGNNGLLSAIASGGAVPNYPGASGMTALTTDSASKFLYITNTQAIGLGNSQSVISAFTINPTTGALQPLAAAGSSTVSFFPTGPSPQCIFEDPSHQFIYTADADGSVITGAAYRSDTGQLANLPKQSTFPTVGTPTWCLYSANTD